MNRDERHDRIAEKPPMIIDADHGITAPLDPKSKGTWIAHNKDGFWGCILNGYFETPKTPKVMNQKSRGQILPNLLKENDPITAAASIDPSQLPSFRLVVGSAKALKLLIWDNESYTEKDFLVNHNDEAFLLSSSSLNQDEVINERAETFKKWLEAGREYNGDTPSFHYEEKPTPESAPMMYRSYSRTKSITSLRIMKTGIKMSYEAIPDRA